LADGRLRIEQDGEWLVGRRYLSDEARTQREEA
jgi:hypothetical protein